MPPKSPARPGCAKGSGQSFAVARSGGVFVHHDWRSEGCTGHDDRINYIEIDRGISVMLIRILSILLILAGLMIHPAAQAQSCSWGCNIVDNRQLNSSLIGQRVYFGDPLNRTAMVVESVDAANRRVYVRETITGSRQWISGYSLYTATEKEERNIAAGAATAATLVFLNSLFGNRSSSSGASSSSSSRNQCERRCAQTTHSHNPRDQAAGEERCRRRC